MARLNWDNASRRRIISERGGEPAWEPDDVSASWSAKERAANQRRRESLYERFKSLPLEERARQASAFKEELSDMCIDAQQLRGAWSLHFAPLLKGAPRPRRAPRTTLSETNPDQQLAATDGTSQVGPRTLRGFRALRPQTSVRSRQLDADRDVAATVVAFVSRHPAAVGPKACAKILAGSTSDKIPHGLRNSAFYGKHRALGRRRIATQISKALKKRQVRIVRGLLVPSQRQR